MSSKVIATVTFDIDLTKLVPFQRDLKPHDHPQEDWARQAVFDLVFQEATLAILKHQMDTIVSKDITEEMRTAIMNLYEMQLERIQETTPNFQLTIREE